MVIGSNTRVYSEHIRVLKAHCQWSYNIAGSIPWALHCDLLGACVLPSTLHVLVGIFATFLIWAGAGSLARGLPRSERICLQRVTNIHHLRGTCTSGELAPCLDLDKSTKEKRVRVSGLLSYTMATYALTESHKDVSFLPHVRYHVSSSQG